MSKRGAVKSCVYATRQTPFHRHFHNVHELLYVCGGAIKVQIGDKEYLAPKNTLLFISKLEEHSIEILPREGAYLRYFIELSPAQLDRMVDDPKLKSVFVSRAAEFNHCFDMSPIAPQIDRLFNEMHREFEAEEAYSDEFFAAQFRQLMILSYRIGAGQFPLPQKNFNQAIYRAQQYIDEHFTEDCSVSRLAQKLFLSPCYLSHAFKAWTGYSPKQYVMLSRISYAKELLISTELTILEISSKCGFGDPNNFIRAFRLETGETPSQYRKRR